MFETLDTPEYLKQDLVKALLYLPSSPLIQEESKRVSLIVVPLSLLEEEQAEKLKRMAGALNGDTNTRKNRHELGAGVYYTHSKHT